MTRYRSSYLIVSLKLEVRPIDRITLLAKRVVTIKTRSTQQVFINLNEKTKHIFPQPQVAYICSVLEAGVRKGRLFVYF
jgi:hypothetical protein